MSQSPIPDSTARSIPVIAAETGLEEPVVRQVVEAYVGKIIQALSKEVPFSIRGFARLFHRYTTPTKRPVAQAEHYENKVHREVGIFLFPDAKSRLHGWVHDLGIKNNQKQELLKLKIRPDEIEKIRRRKTLQEQRSLGFRSELLFSDAPQSDTSLESDLGQSPTVEQLTRRIGMNLDD